MVTVGLGFGTPQKAPGPMVGKDRIRQDPAEGEAGGRDAPYCLCELGQAAVRQATGGTA